MATKKTGKKPAGPKIFDIMRPGESAPSASSRPIIITNRPALQDPMVVATASGGDTSSDTKATAQLAPSSAKVIEPLHVIEPDTSDTVEPVTKTDVEASGAVDKPVEPAEPTEVFPAETEGEAVTVARKSVPAALAEQKAADEAADAHLAKPEVSGSHVPDDTAAGPSDKLPTGTSPDQAAAPADGQESDTTKSATDLKIDEEAARKAAQRSAELDKLAEDRTYYLPINQVEERRNKHVAWIGVLLIIILCIAWADIALDAGIIKLGGIQPVTHFFNR